MYSEGVYMGVSYWFVNTLFIDQLGKRWYKTRKRIPRTCIKLCIIHTIKKEKKMYQIVMYERLSLNLLLAHCTVTLLSFHIWLCVFPLLSHSFMWITGVDRSLVRFAYIIGYNICSQLWKKYSATWNGPVIPTGNTWTEFVRATPTYTYGLTSLQSSDPAVTTRPRKIGSTGGFMYIFPHEK